MVRRSPIQRGDIVRLDLEPTKGNEIRGSDRPALVISTAEFNSFGTAIVVPITQGGNLARDAGFAVPLGNGTETQGVIVCNQLRSVDLSARGARKVERAPDVIVQDVLARIETIFE